MTSLYLKFFRTARIWLWFLIFYTSIEGLAQQPGGVSGTRLWYVSKKGSPNLLIDNSSHNYASPGTSATNNQNRDINFHPATYINGELNFPKLKNIDINQATLIAVFFPKEKFNWEQLNFIKLKSGKSDYTVWYDEIYSDFKPMFPFGDPKKRTTFEIDTKNTYLNNAMKAGVFHFASSRLNNSIWRRNRQLEISGQFTGYIPEILLYNKVLSPLEIIKVKTYLAIRYGITQDTSYVIRDGSTIWDINDPLLRRFHNRVSVIAKDSAAAIIQSKSNTSYEEEYESYKHNSMSDGLTPNPNFTFIPAIDSPSLYRSLTIGFSDMKSIPNNTYLIWGDDKSKIRNQPFLYLDKSNQVEELDRIWLMKNPSRQKCLLKITLAGKSYFDDNPERAKTIFEKMYYPFDYQFYRYLLIKLNSPNLNDTAKFYLNTYFGREQSKLASAENFSTRFLVWDSIGLDKDSLLNYFTFGRIPLLSFWEVGKLSSKKFTKINLSYRYERQKPLVTATFFDTAIYNFKAGDTIQIKMSKGAAPITIRYKEDRLGAEWKNLNDTSTINKAPDLPESGQITPSIQTTQTNDSTKAEQSQELRKGDVRYITKQIWKKNLPSQYFLLPGIKTSTTYLIEATDRFGQRSILSIRLKPTAH